MFELHLDLTEVEGRTIEANRLWTLAQGYPRLHAELMALELVNDGIYAGLDGRQELIDYGSNMGFTANETKALQVLARYVKRRVKADKQGRKNRKTANIGNGGGDNG